MQFSDAAPISGARITRDGYLVADAKVSRTGVQLYRGCEVGRPGLDTVRVYRPEAEVFSDAAMAGMAHRPVTNDHPSERVTADNWRQHAVGMTGGDLAKDGKFLRVPMTVMDSAAIRDVQSGKRELSVGYTCDLAFEAGTSPEGEVYDAIQRNIRPNHLAIVQAGRAGRDCRVGDEGPGPHPTGDRHMALKTIIVDGLPVETTDAGEAAVNKLRGMLDASARALETAQRDHKAALDVKDADLGKKDAEVADLKTKVVTGAALDKLVADRAAVVSKAKALAPTLDTAGKSNADIKRAAVAAKLGDEKVKDRAEAYIDGLFDHLTADVRVADPLREAIKDAAPALTGDAKALADAKAARLQHLHTASRQSAAA